MNSRTGKLVSVIVPAYNCEKYIGRCLESLINQTYGNIEIIVIDDGSVDATASTVECYVKSDSRVKMYKQKNAGPNAARRRGVLKSSGTYMMFVDADDYLIEDAVDILLGHMEKYEVDAIRFDGRFYPSNDKLPSSDFCLLNNHKILRRNQLLSVLLRSYNLNSLCLQFYNADLLKKVNVFDVSISYGEDYLANLRIMSGANNMLIVDDALYFYCDNPNSTTRKLSREQVIRNFSDRVQVFNDVAEYVSKSMSDEEAICGIVYSQTKMLRDALIKVAYVDNFEKDRFVDDIGRLLPKGSLLYSGSCGVERYISTLGVMERIKNKRIVHSILSYDYDAIWYWVFCWKPYLRHIIRAKDEETTPGRQ